MLEERGWMRRKQWWADGYLGARKGICEEVLVQSLRRYMHTHSDSTEYYCMGDDLKHVINNCLIILIKELHPV